MRRDELSHVYVSGRKVLHTKYGRGSEIHSIL